MAKLIYQGDIYWIGAEYVPDSAEAIPHPYVVIQESVINQSRVATVVVCAISSNLKRASIAGNLLLDLGEGNLAKQSVVEVSKVSAVAKTELGAYIGTLSPERVGQILAGMHFQQASFFQGKPE
jgi:mRNA interferase MazF